MKKIISFLVIMILLTVASASADQHLEIFCAFNGSVGGRTETIDLYEQDGQLFAVSTLFPEYTVEMNNSPDMLTGFKAFCMLNPEMFSEMEEAAETYIRKWIDQQLSDSVYGVYSGELFEKAVTLQKAETTLAKLTDHIRKETGNDTSPAVGIISSFAEWISHAYGGKEIRLDIQCFDDWKYFCIRMYDGDNILMTVSADYSQEDEKHFLVGYREESRNIFRDIRIRNEKKSVAIVSSFGIGKDSSFHSLSGQNWLYSEKIILSSRMNMYELAAEKLSEPLTVYGSPFTQEDGQSGMEMKLSIGGREEEIIHVQISLEPLIRPVSFSDKKIISETDQEGMNLIVLEATANMTDLAAGIYPSLPAEYQQLLLKLMYQ